MIDGAKPESLTLRYLRRIDEKVDGLREDLGEVKPRLGRLETNLGELHVDFALIHMALAEHSRSGFAPAALDIFHCAATKFRPIG